MEKILSKMNISSESVGASFIVVFMALYILSNLIIGFVWPLFILAMLIGFVISLLYPRSGILALIFLTIVFERFFTLQSFFIGKVEYKFYPLDIVLIGVVLSVAVQYIFSRKNKFRKVDRVLLVFMLLNFVYFVASIFFLKTDSVLAFSAFKNYAFYSLLYFVVLSLIRKQEDLQRAFQFFLAGAVAIIIFLLLGIVQGEGLWSQYTPLSTGGVRILAFTHGLYMSLALLPAILYVVFNKTKNYFLQILIVIWSLGIVGTLMRHLWIAIFLIFIGLYIFLPKDRKIKLRKIIQSYVLVMGVFLIVLLYAVSLLPQSNLNSFVGDVFGVVSERASSLSNVSSDESFSWRNLVWSGAYEKFKASPILGIGTGQDIYVESGKYKDFIEIRNIHNSYLAILIQLGLIGFVVFGFFIWSTIKRLWQTKGDEKYSFYKFSILSVVGIYLIAIMFQPYLETNLLAIFFWISLGLARILPEINFTRKEI